jgi:hypothetical protein
MIVEYDNGNRRLVFGDHLIGINASAPLTDFKDDLTGYFDLDINKVYCHKKGEHACHITLTNMFGDDDITLIWERKEKPEPVEMTIEEICKALGKEIKIVKG